MRADTEVYTRADTVIDSSRSSRIPPSETPARARFLSEAECREVANRVASFTEGGGITTTTIVSTWTGNVRWARNRIITSGEIRNTHLIVNRTLNGASSPFVHFNDLSDAALVAGVRRAERIAQQFPEVPGYDLARYFQPEPHESPALFSDATYQLEAEQRSAAAYHLMRAAKDAGMLSAGYIEVSAQSMAFMTSSGYARYFPYTWAQFSTTVRDPKGTGSGWAGVDGYDWSTINGEALTSVALDKCLKSRNPVVIEPGRYTTILEPQAVCELVGFFMWNISGNTPFETGILDYFGNQDRLGSFNKMPGASKLGNRVIDERITISADPNDPEIGFPPFTGIQNMYDTAAPNTPMYHPVTWIKNGVLTNLSYDRFEAIRDLGRATGQRNSGAFRMSVTGPQTSVEEMIATTKRGLLVTRVSNLMGLDFTSILCRGYTRDGLWLIENGKISHPVKNLAFTESPLFVLNNVEQLGTPQRAFHPPARWQWFRIPQPAMVPSLKVRDFSFTALSDAV